MSKKALLLLKAVLLVVVLSVLLGGSSCSIKEDKVFVTWMDTDGTLIESQTVTSNYDPTERSLPNDSELWHYTDWTISRSGNVIVVPPKELPKSILYGKIITERS